MARTAKTCPKMGNIEHLILAGEPKKLRPAFKHAEGCLACKGKLVRLGAWPLGCIDPFDGYLVRLELDEDTQEAEKAYDKHRAKCAVCAHTFKKAAQLRPPAE